MRKPRKNKSFPYVFAWQLDGREVTSHVLPVPCQLCAAVALVELPASLAAEQTDGTTHVCHPGAGGCNHGFAP